MNFSQQVSAFRTCFSILLLLAVYCLMPASTLASEVERAGVQVNVIEPEDFGYPPLGGTFYNPTGIKIGNELFLYVQGGQHAVKGGPGTPCEGDKIFLFRAPWTTSGLKSQFQWDSQAEVIGEGVVGRISPCKTTKYHYGLGGVFQLGSQYVMILDQVNWPDANIFRETLVGFSNDGQAWSWEPFVKSTGNYSILDVTLKAADLASCFCNPGCFCHHKAWGFFRFGFGDNGSERVGKMQVDFSDQYPRGFRVWIQSGGLWKQVDDSTGEYSFQPDDVRPSTASFVPNALVDNNGQLELWAYENNVTGCGCSHGTGSTFLYRPVSFGTVGSITGGRVSVFSNQRCMPSNNGVGRLFPFVITGPDGKRLLYSTSNDKNCSHLQSGGSPFQGMYIVVTEFQ